MIFELFNPSFLMCLGIMLLIISGLVVYFESKMRDQTHKITTMFSIVSSLTDELNDTKIYVNNCFNQKYTNSQTKTVPIRNELINVSDDEGNDDEDEDEEDENENNDENEDEDEDENENDENDDDENDDIEDVEEDEEDEEISINYKKIKLLNIHLNNSNEINHTNDLNNLEDLVNSKELYELDELDEDELDKNEIISKSINNENDTHIPQSFDLKTVYLNENDTFISTSTLHESNTNDLDYKKLSVQKLREIVTQKALVEDCSKMKKHTLLNLLEM